MHSPCLRYIGVDISAVIIARNREKPGLQNGLDATFVVADAVGDDLRLLAGRHNGGAAVDLLFCRHMMLHLSVPDNIQALRNFAVSGARFVMATTFLRPGAQENGRGFQLALGHHINLLAAPYCLPDPVRLYSEEGPDMYMGLWETGELRARVEAMEAVWLEHARSGREINCSAVQRSASATYD
jgi:hypothetical protein